MSKNFEFNAPQFINFSNLDDPEGDSFFENKTQEDQNIRSVNLTFPAKSKDVTNDKSSAENREPNTLVKVDNPNASKNSYPVLRKVLHEIVNHSIPNDANNSAPTETPSKKTEKEILLKLEKLHISEPKLKQVKTPVNATDVFSDTLTKSNKRKSHRMITRLDVVSNRPQQISPLTANFEEKENSIAALNRTNIPVSLVQQKMKRNASPLYSARKFISLAEQVEHFHKDTPERFRTKPNKITFINRPTCERKPHACIPKTPNLTTKFRSRKINFPNEREREEIELEEIKKHQVKANPLNKKILLGPTLNLKMPVIKKPATVPQPFSLTEVKKKEQHHEPVFHFKAQPVPNTILHGPIGIPPKKTTAPTVPTTPQIRVPLRFRVEVNTPLSHEKTPSQDSLNPPRKTKIEPFSFDCRMKEVLEKKHEYIKRVLEEEKKTFSSFKAQPMPAFKVKSDPSLRVERTPIKTIPQPFNLTQTKSSKNLPESEPIAERVTPFKARPASVVRQKPFVPKLPKHEPPVLMDFHLNTEKRALERQKFDEKIKQKEEEIRQILKLQKKEEEELERELALEERKKAEFKAKPMPHYKVFEIHAADPTKLTLPQSPNFSTKLREAKKLNSNC